MIIQFQRRACVKMMQITQWCVRHVQISASLSLMSMVAIKRDVRDAASQRTNICVQHKCLEVAAACGIII
jgi:hypothetical protein